MADTSQEIETGSPHTSACANASNSPWRASGSNFTTTPWRRVVRASPSAQQVQTRTTSLNAAALCLPERLEKPLSTSAQTNPLPQPQVKMQNGCDSCTPPPSTPISPTPRPQLPSAYKFNEAEMRRGLRALPLFSAAGLDGLRTCHLKSLANTLGGVDPQRSPLKELTKFVNSAVDGQLPPSMRDWIAGAALLGMPKGTKLRPIAVGLALRRFVSRLLMRKATQDPALKAYFQPHQLAVGTKAGCEAILHAVRHTVETMEREGALLVQIDASNAFNAVERSVILKQCTTHLAPLSRWVHYAYGGQPILLFGEFIILSLTGVQQGDPLSMLLFSLALQPLLKKLSGECPHLDLSAFFADDGTLIGDPDSLIAALNLLITEGAKIGFHINVDKTKGWWPRASSTNAAERPTLLPGLPCRISNDDAIELLGAPIGTADGCRRIMEDKLKSVATMWDRINDLNDPIYHTIFFDSVQARQD